MSQKIISVQELFDVMSCHDIIFLLSPTCKYLRRFLFSDEYWHLRSIRTNTSYHLNRHLNHSHLPLIVPACASENLRKHCNHPFTDRWDLSEARNDRTEQRIRKKLNFIDSLKARYLMLKLYGGKNLSWVGVFSRQIVAALHQIALQPKIPPDTLSFCLKLLLDLTPVPHPSRIHLFQIPFDSIQQDELALYRLRYKWSVTEDFFQSKAYQRLLPDFLRLPLKDPAISQYAHHILSSKNYPSHVVQFNTWMKALMEDEILRAQDDPQFVLNRDSVFFKIAISVPQHPFTLPWCLEQMEQAPEDSLWRQEFSKVVENMKPRS